MARVLLRAQRRSEDDETQLERWIDAAQAGDSEAFGCIWQQFSPGVHGYLRARGVASADDVTSEVFLAALTGLGRFMGTASEFRSWLFTIAHHKSVDDSRHRRNDAEYLADTDPRTTPSAEVTAIESVIDEYIHVILGGLTGDQREVLLLRALGYLSLEQVAEVTGRTVGAVKQLYHRAVATSQRVAVIDRALTSPPGAEVMGQVNTVVTRQVTVLDATEFVQVGGDPEDRFN